MRIPGPRRNSNELFFEMEVLFSRSVVLVFLLVFTTLVKGQNVVLDCNGKRTICVGPLHYLPCVDKGNGKMESVDGLAQICPVGTECSTTGPESCVSMENNAAATAFETISSTAQSQADASQKATRAILTTNTVHPNEPTVLPNDGAPIISEALSIPSVGQKPETITLPTTPSEQPTDYTPYARVPPLPIREYIISPVDPFMNAMPIDTVQPEPFQEQMLINIKPAAETVPATSSSVTDTQTDQPIEILPQVTDQLFDQTLLTDTISQVQSALPTEDTLVNPSETPEKVSLIDPTQQLIDIPAEQVSNGFTETVGITPVNEPSTGELAQSQVPSEGATIGVGQAPEETQAQGLNVKPDPVELLPETQQPLQEAISLRAEIPSGQTLEEQVLPETMTPETGLDTVAPETLAAQEKLPEQQGSISEPSATIAVAPIDKSSQFTTAGTAPDIKPTDELPLLDVPGKETTQTVNDTPAESTAADKSIPADAPVQETTQGVNEIPVQQTPTVNDTPAKSTAVDKSIPVDAPVQETTQGVNEIPVKQTPDLASALDATTNDLIQTPNEIPAQLITDAPAQLVNETTSLSVNDTTAQEVLDVQTDQPPVANISTDTVNPLDSKVSTEKVVEISAPAAPLTSSADITASTVEKQVISSSVIPPETVVPSEPQLVVPTSQSQVPAEIPVEEQSAPLNVEQAPEATTPSTIQPIQTSTNSAVETSPQLVSTVEAAEEIIEEAVAEPEPTLPTYASEAATPTAKVYLSGPTVAEAQLALPTSAIITAPSGPVDVRVIDPAGDLPGSEPYVESPVTDSAGVNLEATPPAVVEIMDAPPTGTSLVGTLPPVEIGNIQDAAYVTSTGVAGGPSSAVSQPGGQIPIASQSPESQIISAGPVTSSLPEVLVTPAASNFPEPSVISGSSVAGNFVNVFDPSNFITTGSAATAAQAVPSSTSFGGQITSASSSSAPAVTAPNIAVTGASGSTSSAVGIAQEVTPTMSSYASSVVPTEGIAIGAQQILSSISFAGGPVMSSGLSATSPTELSSATSPVGSSLGSEIGGTSSTAATSGTQGAEMIDLSVIQVPSVTGLAPTSSGTPTIDIAGGGIVLDTVPSAGISVTGGNGVEATISGTEMAGAASPGINEASSTSIIDPSSIGVIFSTSSDPSTSGTQGLSISGISSISSADPGEIKGTVSEPVISSTGADPSVVTSSGSSSGTQTAETTASGVQTSTADQPSIISSGLSGFSISGITTVGSSSSTTLSSPGSATSAASEPSGSQVAGTTTSVNEASGTSIAESSTPTGTVDTNAAELTGTSSTSAGSEPSSISAAITEKLPTEVTGAESVTTLTEPLASSVQGSVSGAETTTAAENQVASTTTAVSGAEGTTTVSGVGGTTVLEPQSESTSASGSQPASISEVPASLAQGSGSGAEITITAEPQVASTSTTASGQPASISEAPASSAQGSGSGADSITAAEPQVVSTSTTASGAEGSTAANPQVGSTTTAGDSQTTSASAAEIVTSPETSVVIDSTGSALTDTSTSSGSPTPESSPVATAEIVSAPEPNQPSQGTGTSIAQASEGSLGSTTTVSETSAPAGSETSSGAQSAAISSAAPSSEASQLIPSGTSEPLTIQAGDVITSSTAPVSGSNVDLGGSNVQIIPSGTAVPEATGLGGSLVSSASTGETSSLQEVPVSIQSPNEGGLQLPTSSFTTTSGAESQSPSSAAKPAAIPSGTADQTTASSASDKTSSVSIEGASSVPSSAITFGGLDASGTPILIPMGTSTPQTDSGATSVTQPKPVETSEPVTVESSGSAIKPSGGVVFGGLDASGTPIISVAGSSAGEAGAATTGSENVASSVLGSGAEASAPSVDSVSSTPTDIVQSGIASEATVDGGAGANLASEVAVESIVSTTSGSIIDKIITSGSTTGQVEVAAAPSQDIGSEGSVGASGISGLTISSSGVNAEGALDKTESPVLSISGISVLGGQPESGVSSTPGIDALTIGSSTTSSSILPAVILDQSGSTIVSPISGITFGSDPTQSLSSSSDSFTSIGIAEEIAATSDIGTGSSGSSSIGSSVGISNGGLDISGISIATDSLLSGSSAADNVPVESASSGISLLPPGSLSLSTGDDDALPGISILPSGSLSIAGSSDISDQTSGSTIGTIDSGISALPLGGIITATGSASQGFINSYQGDEFETDVGGIGAGGSAMNLLPTGIVLNTMDSPQITESQFVNAGQTDNLGPSVGIIQGVIGGFDGSIQSRPAISTHAGVEFPSQAPSFVSGALPVSEIDGFGIDTETSEENLSGDVQGYSTEGDIYFDYDYSWFTHPYSKTQNRPVPTEFMKGDDDNDDDDDDDERSSEEQASEEKDVNNSNESVNVASSEEKQSSETSDEIQAGGSVQNVAIGSSGVAIQEATVTSDSSIVISDTGNVQKPTVPDLETPVVPVEVQQATATSDSSVVIPDTAIVPKPVVTHLEAPAAPAEPIQEIQEVQDVLDLPIIPEIDIPVLDFDEPIILQEIPKESLAFKEANAQALSTLKVEGDKAKLVVTESSVPAVNSSEPVVTESAISSSAKDIPNPTDIEINSQPSSSGRLARSTPAPPTVEDLNADIEQMLMDIIQALAPSKAPEIAEVAEILPAVDPVSPVALQSDTVAPAENVETPPVEVGIEADAPIISEPAQSTATSGKPAEAQEQIEAQEASSSKPAGKPSSSSHQAAALNNDNDSGSQAESAQSGSQEQTEDEGSNEGSVQEEDDGSDEETQDDDEQTDDGSEEEEDETSVQQGNDDDSDDESRERKVSKKQKKHLKRESKRIVKQQARIQKFIEEQDRIMEEKLKKEAEERKKQMEMEVKKKEQEMETFEQMELNEMKAREQSELEKRKEFELREKLQNDAFDKKQVLRTIKERPEELEIARVYINNREKLIKLAKKVYQSMNPNEPKFQCTEPGYFADPENCRKYYICYSKSASSTELRMVHLECEAHRLFDTVSSICSNYKEAVCADERYFKAFVGRQ